MNTIIPWISGGLILLLVLGAWQTIRFWRESKKSPYYFLRRQAEQKMQTYSMGTVASAVLLLFFVSYAWQPAEDTSIRMIEIHNAKPQSLTAAPTTESTQIINQQSTNIFVGKNVQTLSMKDLAVGVYTLKLTIAEQSASYRVVVQR